jgi:hypothetical protein
VKNLFSETTAFVSSLTKNPFTAIEVISLTGRVNAMPEGKGRKLAEKRLQDLRSKYYNEDLYRTPIGWSVLVSILLVFVFSVVYFIYSA